MRYALIGAAVAAFLATLPASTTAKAMALSAPAQMNSAIDEMSATTKAWYGGGYYRGGYYRRGYYGYRPWRPYYGGYYRPWRPYYGGYYRPWRPYYGGYYRPWRPYAYGYYRPWRPYYGPRVYYGFRPYWGGGFRPAYWW